MYVPRQARHWREPSRVRRTFSPSSYPFPFPIDPTAESLEAPSPPSLCGLPPVPRGSSATQTKTAGRSVSSRQRFFMGAISGLLLCMLTLMALPATVDGQTECDFILGFKALRDQIPDIVGDCLEDEYFNLESGNAEQLTTGGLLVWRQAYNLTAFTDGTTAWINGPFGLQSRPSGESFAWEGGSQPTPPPAWAQTSPIAPQVPPGLRLIPQAQPQSQHLLGLIPLLNLSYLREVMDNPFIHVYVLLLATVVIVPILWRIRTRLARRSEDQEIIARRLAQVLEAEHSPPDASVQRAAAYVQPAEPQRAIGDSDKAIAQEEIIARRLAQVLEAEHPPPDASVQRAAAYVQPAEPQPAIGDPDKAIGPMSREAYKRRPAAGDLDVQGAAINHELTSFILIGVIGLIGSASVVFNLPNALEGSVVFAARMAVGLLGLVVALLLWLRPPTGWSLARTWALVQIPVVAWNSEGSPTAQAFSLELAFQADFFKVGVNLAGAIFTAWLARWRERFQPDSSIDLPVAAATDWGVNLAKKLFLLAGVLATAAVIVNAALLSQSAMQYGDATIPRVFGSWDYQELAKESERAALNTYRPDTEMTFAQIKSRLGTIQTYQGITNAYVTTNLGVPPWSNQLHSQSMLHTRATMQADITYDRSTASIMIYLIHYPFGSGWKIIGFNVSSPALHDLTQK
jgi:hypothetical protein